MSNFPPVTVDQGNSKMASVRSIRTGTSSQSKRQSATAERHFSPTLSIPVLATWHVARNRHLHDPIGQKLAASGRPHRIDDDPLIKMAGDDHCVTAEERLRRDGGRHRIWRAKRGAPSSGRAVDVRLSESRRRQSGYPPHRFRLPGPPDRQTTRRPSRLARRTTSAATRSARRPETLARGLEQHHLQAAAWIEYCGQR